jgi:branched-chain amino acid transport system permease protein
MSYDIALFLAQDGVTVGAIYALLAIALVLVFTVTRIIFIPQGEFVSYGALTLAALRTERVPGTTWLLLLLAFVVVARELWRAFKGSRQRSTVGGTATLLAVPLVVCALAYVVAPLKLPLWADTALAVAIVLPIGTLLYRLAYEPLEHASVLVLLIASVGVHLALIGLGLAMFGAEGSRTPPFSDFQGQFGPLLVSGRA